MVGNDLTSAHLIASISISGRRKKMFGMQFRRGLLAQARVTEVAPGRAVYQPKLTRAANFCHSKNR